MDHYVVELFGEDFGAPNIEFLSDWLKNGQKKMSIPYIECFFKQRKTSVHGVSLRLTATPEKSCGDIENWSILHLEDHALRADEILSVSCHAASDILLKLSDNLPIPGSIILNIFWDMRSINSVDKISDIVPLFGAVRKMCSWHQGHLEVFCDEQLHESLKKYINFMDPHANIHEASKDIPINIPLHDRTLWRGHLKIFTEDTSIHLLPGFVLSKQTIPEPEIRLHKKSSSEDRPCTSNDSFAEDDQGYVWMDPAITVLSFIDLTTVPLFYFSGKRFTLQYQINEQFEDNMKTVESMCDALSSGPGAFLCGLNYAVSRHQFDAVSEHSSEKWRQAVLKQSAKLDAPKCKSSLKIETLHFLLRQSDNDRTIKVFNGNPFVQFTAHLLYRPQELDLRLPFEKDSVEEMPEGFSDLSEFSTVDLPGINPGGLLYKEQNFNHLISQAIKHWIDNNGTDSIPMLELQKLVNETVQNLHSKEESVLLDVTNLSKLRDPIKHPESPDCAALFEWHKRAFANMDKMRDKERSKLQPQNPLLSNSTKNTLDMHLKPQDILKHFTSSGDPLLMKSASQVELPSLKKLSTFQEAIKMSYHGITYNIDERAAEKFDRMCRRLVERRVKFETCSIGSTEKVPSPATINIADSPMKQSKLISSNVPESQKRLQLKKVAEKLYKKRIRTRSTASSASSNPGPSTMILRSTPTKSKGGDSHQKSTANKLKRDPEVSAEDQKRRNRRTYVQDNKKRLQDLVTQSLSEYGITKQSKKFDTCSKRLYNVSMAFLRDLKSSKDLDRIMKDTVSNNVQSVISFKTK